MIASLLRECVVLAYLSNSYCSYLQICYKLFIHQHYYYYYYYYERDCIHF